MKFSKFPITPWFQWSSCLFVSSELCSCILSDFLWFNKHVLIEKKSTYRQFSEKGLNSVYKLLNKNGSVKSWSSIKEEFGFKNFFSCKCQQLTYALPTFWKKIVKETDNAENFYSQITTLLKRCVLNTDISEALQKII